MSDLDKQLMNADSFDELYLAYYPAMLSYARMFLRDQWAEDVVQDVFFNIWKNRHRISTDDPLYKYLLKAVYNRAINYIWKHKRDTEYRSWYGSQIDRMVFDYYDPDKNPILAKIYDNDMRQQLRQAARQAAGDFPHALFREHVEQGDRRAAGADGQHGRESYVSGAEESARQTALTSGRA